MTVAVNYQKHKGVAGKQCAPPPSALHHAVRAPVKPTRSLTALAVGNAIKGFQREKHTEKSTTSIGRMSIESALKTGYEDKDGW